MLSSTDANINLDAEKAKANMPLTDGVELHDENKMRQKNFEKYFTFNRLHSISQINVICVAFIARKVFTQMNFTQKHLTFK